MGNYTIFQMPENPRRGRQTRTFTTNFPKILDLKSCKIIFGVPLTECVQFGIQLIWSQLFYLSLNELCYIWLETLYRPENQVTYFILNLFPVSFFLIFRNLKHVEHFEYLVFYFAGSRTCGMRFSKSSLAENSKQHAYPILQMIILEHLWAQLFKGRSISVNPVLNFNLGSSLFCLKSFSWINFSLFFRASSHQIVDKMD